MDSDTQEGGEFDPDAAESESESGAPLYTFGDTESRVSSIVQSLALIIAAFGVGTVLVSGSFVVLRLAGYTYESVESLPPTVQAGAAAVQFVGFLLVGVSYLRWRGDEPSLFEIRLPSIRELGWAVAGLVGLFVMLNIASFVMTALGVQSAENSVIVRGREQPVLFLYLIAVTIFFTAPAEELIFRGLVQGLFRRAYGILPGIVIASVLFGGVHYVALRGEGSPIPYITVAAVLGLLLGSLYEKTENLAVPILVHGAYNAILFYVSYLVATGQMEIPA